MLWNVWTIFKFTLTVKEVNKVIYAFLLYLTVNRRFSWQHKNDKLQIGKCGFQMLEHGLNLTRENKTADLELYSTSIST